MMKGKASGEKLGILFRQSVNFAFSGVARRRRGRCLASLAFCIFTFAFCAVLPVAAQDEPPADAAPPALKKLSKEEQQRLEAEPGVKKRTQLAIDLMEARLKSAETLTAESNYSETLDALAGFHALLENTLGFLLKNDVANGKVQSNFKRFELALRAQTPRLELIRRELPSNYGYHVQKLIRAVRDARSKAVEPLFSDTVVPGNNSGGGRKPTK